MDPVKLFATLAVPLLFMNAGNQAFLVVKHGNTQLLRQKITKNDKKTFMVKLPVGYTAEIEVSDGKACIKPMPNWVCPKHICSNTGKIGLDGSKKIVCMPNQLVVYFEK